ncbi:cytochrome P450 [Sphingorhabdus sp.]|jgi:cytochrome P450|uniref:cytochrome P450 n=2 Tax=Sphingorhabdus sp. TaxID=1902408 RepID=UPI004053A6B2
MTMQLTTTQWPLPDVDDRLIIEFDMFGVQPVDGDIHAGWHEWHSAPDLFYTPLHGGVWVATRADDIHEIMSDDERFSNHGVALIRESGGTRFIPGELDPPIHTAFRKVLNPETSPRRIRAFEESSRKLCINLIEEIQGRRECEFRAAISEKMPIYNFLFFMGLPLEDAETLLPHSNTIVHDHDMTAFAAALEALHAYVDARIDERLENPLDDFISRLLSATIEGRPIAREEVRVTVLNVMLGGLDTVTGSMGFFFNFLARNPDHRRQLAENPSMIPQANEELFRRHAIFNTGRLVKNACEWKGITLRENDLILIPGALHNLDERKFPNPLKVDFERRDGPHITFGVGIHRCLGSNIARMQLKILLEEWLKRIPEFAITAGGEVKAQSGRSNTVTHLPLSW